MIEEIKVELNLKEWQTAHLERILAKYEFREIKKSDWQEHLDHFLNTKLVEGKSSTTVKQYGLEIKSLLKSIDKDLTMIDSQDIFDYLANKKKDKNVSNRTLENKRLIFSSFFTWAFNRNIINSNPILSLNKFKVEKKLRKPFSDEERFLLMEHCRNIKEKALLELLYCSCMRVGELEKVKVKDIDFDKKEITILGKGGKERIVYISAIALMYINQYLSERKVDSDYLLLNQLGTSIKKESIARILKKIGKKAGVENVHPHRFRRTGATNAIRRGMPIQEVSIMLGHEKIETTMIYCDIDQQSVKHNHAKYLSH